MPALQALVGPLLAFSLIGAPAMPSAPPAPASVDGTSSAVSADPTSEGTVAALRREIPGLMRAAGAVGLTIALVDADGAQWTAGFGLADRGARRLVTPSTLFHIGSVSKTLTALAVMRLAETGAVDLDAPLARYVPGFRLQPGYRGDVITVRSVLDHHSGIPGDVFNGLITSGKPDPGYRAWLLRALRAMPPERRTNTMFAYNNAGYVLLQDLVEHVTGESFVSWTRDHVLRPAGMTSSTFDDTIAVGTRLTTNYEAVPGADGSIAAVPAKPREYVNGLAAGSVLSSARDMAAYVRMLLRGGLGDQGRVVSAAALRTMWRPAVRTPLDISYTRFGLGFGVGDPSLDWAGQVVWHDGATAWNRSMLALLPGSGLGVFVSVNTATPSALAHEVAVRALTLAVREHTGRVPPPPVALPACTPTTWSQAALARRAGAYAGTDGVTWIAAGPAGLTIEGTRGVKALTPCTDGWLRTADGEQVTVRTVAGRRLLLVRLPLGLRPVVLVAGERLPDARLGPGWSGRLGRYAAVGMQRRSPTTLVARTLELRRDHGRILMSLSSEFGTQGLAADAHGRVATAGAGFGLGRGKGDVVVPSRTPDGTPALTYLGVRYVRVGR